MMQALVELPDILETDGGTCELIDKVRNKTSIYDAELTIVLQRHLSHSHCLSMGRYE